jgi:hypothetical protein
LIPAEIAPPPPGAPIERLRGEERVEHRAFLLWAMGGPQRSLLAACKSTRKADKVIRRWRAKHEWERRYRETADPDVEAFLVYQREYLAQFGSAAIMRVIESIVPTVGFLTQIDAESLQADEAAARERARLKGTREYEDEDEDGARPVIRPLVSAAPRILDREGYTRDRSEVDKGDPPVKVPPRSRAEIDPLLAGHVMQALAITPEVVQPPGGTPAGLGVGPGSPSFQAGLERDLKLVDASLGYFARKLQAGEIPVKMSDLPILLKVKRLLLGASTSNVAVNVAGAPTHAAVPTVRVQQAKDDDAKLTAYREDLADIMTILDGIAAGRERDAATVTTGDERKEA